MASLLRSVVLAELDAANARMMMRIALETADDVPMRRGATAGGDRRKLRGLPAVGRGCGGGAIAGSDPLGALLARERRAKR